MSANKPILITGSHRSGSTWVGRTMAQCPQVQYIHEPFNIQYPDPGVCGAKFRYWYEYVCPPNDAIYRVHIQRTLKLRYNIIGQLLNARRPGDILRAFQNRASFAASRRSAARPLIKDPLALMSAEWLASQFDMKVLVLIRHPAAFAGSLKIKHWKFPFDHLLKQPALMKMHLAPFEPEIKRAAQTELDIIDQAVLLWKIITHVIAKYQVKHEDWLFLRHEDLSLDPIGSFKKIFSKFNIPFTGQIEDYIKEHCFVDTLNKAGEGVLKRDSRSNIKAWKKRLTALEIEKVKAQVSTLANGFYSDSDW